MGKIYKVATRSSPLAMKQAKMAVEYFSKKIPDAEFEIFPFKTTGDKKLSWSLADYGGKGLFTKELEDALIEGHADFAVHSAKDMPTDIPQGLSLCAYLPRDTVNDVLVLQKGLDVPSLIATGSPRRRAQLKKLFPNAVWTDLRGNVESRLNKIAASAADATVLSSAGLARLGISAFECLIFKEIPISVCVPAAGQGAIAIECRNEDSEFFAAFGDSATALAVALERTFLKALGGGCHVAYGAYYDGALFHIYHEKVGYQKLNLGVVSENAEKFERVRHLASVLLD